MQAKPGCPQGTAAEVARVRLPTTCAAFAPIGKLAKPSGLDPGVCRFESCWGYCEAHDMVVLGHGSGSIPGALRSASPFVTVGLGPVGIAQLGQSTRFGAEKSQVRILLPALR